ncbi:MAG TPA: hypothetical protein VNW06_11565 [Cytophagaceae bacterium]|jgi:hypothetical protein|nr:hypothetical protein [Cytophagaceae bacterium]
METKENLLEPLIERVEEYGKTSFELLKLKSLDKTATISSEIISRLLLMVIVFLFIFTLSMAAGFWLGDMLGENYYGFSLVALFYGLVSVLVYFIQPTIKGRVNNSIIKLMFN